ncbi:uncharacterized protein F4822DRAFT_424232 [Hypoxylon trugodes]|uniref:uncharacterized protein n=1 Tax=Hypoxylon trugodes TaxID=326681 RepID=UPI00218E1D90|nr:uncharacterized protein F4822DRAFT_424232 [Hypoxylon trugodes]KAI1393769.1 hypothetical protein F4822DRAFT_424232 [Hypoxylon trugodes]
MKVSQLLPATLALAITSVWALPQPTNIVAVVTTTELVARKPAVSYTGTQSHTNLRARASHTGTQSQTNLRARASHTGTQSQTNLRVRQVETSITTPAPSASSASFTGKCDYSYCESGSEYCFYWAGVTSYDVSLGPVPGEVRTVIGTC